MPVKDTSGSVVRTLRPPANPAWQNEVGGVWSDFSKILQSPVEVSRG